jgi:hypothetical protein
VVVLRYVLIESCVLGYGRRPIVTNSEHRKKEAATTPEEALSWRDLPTSLFFVPNKLGLRVGTGVQLV